MREYKAGKVSFNFYLMYEDIIHLFKDDLIEKIFNFNIINNFYIEPDLGKIVNKYFLKKENTFISEIENRSDFSLKVIEAIKSYKSGEYNKAFDIYNNLLAFYPDRKIIYINMIRCVLCNNGFTSKQANDYVFNLFKSDKTPSKFLLLSIKVEKLFKRLWKK